MIVFTICVIYILIYCTNL